jgi:hypothetical protein
MTEAKSLALLCGVCCVWPSIVATLAVFAYRRYQIGGWRSVLFGKQNDNPLP